MVGVRPVFSWQVSVSETVLVIVSTWGTVLVDVWFWKTVLAILGGLKKLPTEHNRKIKTKAPMDHGSTYAGCDRRSWAQTCGSSNVASSLSILVPPFLTAVIAMQWGEVHGVGRQKKQKTANPTFLLASLGAPL